MQPQVLPLVLMRMTLVMQQHDFDAALVARSYMDVVVIVLTSYDLADNISPDPLDVFHSLSSCYPPLPMSFSICHQLNIMICLRGRRLTMLNPQVPLKGITPPLTLIGRITITIMLTTVFDCSNNFLKAFDKFWRALTIISEFKFKCSYSRSYELYVQVFGKLLRAFMVSDLVAWIL